MWLLFEKNTQNQKEKQQGIIQEVSGAGKGWPMCFSPGCKGQCWSLLGEKPLVSA